LVTAEVLLMTVTPEDKGVVIGEDVPSVFASFVDSAEMT